MMLFKTAIGAAGLLLLLTSCTETTDNSIPNLSTTTTATTRPSVPISDTALKANLTTLPSIPASSSDTKTSPKLRVLEIVSIKAVPYEPPELRHVAPRFPAGHPTIEITAKMSTFIDIEVTTPSTLWVGEERLEIAPGPWSEPTYVFRSYYPERLEANAPMRFGQQPASLGDPLNLDVLYKP